MEAERVRSDAAVERVSVRLRGVDEAHGRTADAGRLAAQPHEETAGRSTQKVDNATFIAVVEKKSTSMTTIRSKVWGSKFERRSHQYRGAAKGAIFNEMSPIISEAVQDRPICISTYSMPAHTVELRN